MVAASYLGLSAIYPPALAALMVGGGLIILAGFIWLVSEAMANRRRSHGGIAPLARAAVGAQSGEDAVNQIVGALKQESPLTVLAAAAGLLFGLFMRNRHHG
jgi:hypothetical protein